MANTTGFKARVEYEVTDGTQKTYTFPFSYLRKKFVMVSILHSDATETALEYGVDYTVSDLSVSLTTPAQVGEHIIIYRQTSTDKIVTWNDGSILLARDMNTEDAQMLHLQEEQHDYIMAHAISTKVTSDKEVLWDALNHRVINVSDPKDPQDAVTKNYMETVQGGFVAANTKILNDAKSTLSATQQTQSKAQSNETLSKAWATSTESPDNAEDTQSSTGKTQSSRSWALYSKEKAQEGATSATNALTSEQHAKTSETNALTSEQHAKTSETNALTSEQHAKTSETNALTSEQHAKTSETNAKTSETKASASASASASSASESATSAAKAKTSETNAKTSETNSEISHQLAKKWAEATDSPDGEADTDSTTGKTQSSKEWALYSKTKAQEAATSATNAKSSETNAKTSETNAKTAETNAKSSETNAKTSETNAKSSETKSKDSENAARVSEQNAAESARIATEYGGDFNMLKRNKTYSVGDIAYSPSLPSWARLECVTAGTTADTLPSSIITVSSGGVLISDGTVTWIIDDVRDMTPVGCVRGSLFLPKGYIKANGATVQRADYPRLVQFIESNNLWTDDTTNNAGLFGKGDGSSTFVLPDYRERMVQYTEDSIGKQREAGLPNITGVASNYADCGLIRTNGNHSVSGCFYEGEQTAWEINGDDERDLGRKLNFDASHSNPIYGSSDTVQPPAINVIPILRY